MIWLYVVGFFVYTVALSAVSIAYGRKIERQATAYLRSVLDSVDKTVE